MGSPPEPSHLCPPGEPIPPPRGSGLGHRSHSHPAQLPGLGARSRGSASRTPQTCWRLGWCPWQGWRAPHPWTLMTAGCGAVAAALAAAPPHPPGSSAWPGCLGGNTSTWGAVSCMGTPKCWCQARQELLHQGKATGLAEATLLEESAASMSQVSQTALTAPR